MPDLPAIIEAIVQQRPGVAPDWLEDHGATGWRDARTGERFCTDAAILIIEAAMWRANYGSETGPKCRVYWTDEDGWCAENEEGKNLDCDSGRLALVRALCHAIGIEVASA